MRGETLLLRSESAQRTKPASGSFGNPLRYPIRKDHLRGIARGATLYLDECAYYRLSIETLLVAQWRNIHLIDRDSVITQIREVRNASLYSRCDS